MVVNSEMRNRGIGTYIISKLKEQCYSKNLIPICSCDKENIASKKTLEKSGFVSIHKIINVEF
jgi:predicted acetyltransferase